MASIADFAVILPAAGQGSRFGGDKLAQLICGASVLEHSIRAFIDRPDVAAVVVVRDLGNALPVSQALASHAKLRRCAGGALRVQSVLCGLRQVQELAVPPTYVAIHDAARPAVSQGLVDRVFGAARAHGAAVPGLAVTDTIKRVSEGVVVETLARDHLLAVQTPQAMRRDWLEEALARCGGLEAVTDDVQLLEMAGFAVRAVEAEATNLKITRPEDLPLAERVLMQRMRGRGAEDAGGISSGAPAP